MIKSLINIERTVDLCVTDDKVLPTDERPRNGHKLLNQTTTQRDLKNRMHGHKLKHNKYSNRTLNHIHVPHEGHVTVLYWTNSGNRSWTVTVDSKNFICYLPSHLRNMAPHANFYKLISIEKLIVSVCRYHRYVLYNGIKSIY